jgi:hypothetical protein
MPHFIREITQMHKMLLDPDTHIAQAQPNGPIAGMMSDL